MWLKFALCACLLVSLGEAAREHLINGLTERDVLPEVNDETCPGLYTLIFGNTYGEVNVFERLDQLTPAQAKDKPTEIGWPHVAENYYTLLFIDLDAPKRDAQPDPPTTTQYLHGLVMNIPGEDRKLGETVKSYRGPGPPPGSGFHRYTVLIFQQQGFIDSVPSSSSISRPSFSTKKLIQDYNLNPQPVACNMFESQREKSLANKKK